MQDEIRVSMNEMKKAYYPDILYSGGLGPCIAIGIHDPKTRSGYMLHEPHFQYSDLDGSIKKIMADYSNLARLKVFCAGNSLSSWGDAELRAFEKSDRLHVEQTLKKYFRKSQIRIEWVDDDCIAELFLDTSTGEFELNVESLDELLE